jgi:hypothetical protein
LIAFHRHFRQPLADIYATLAPRFRHYIYRLLFHQIIDYRPAGLPLIFADAAIIITPDDVILIQAPYATAPPLCTLLRRHAVLQMPAAFDTPARRAAAAMPRCRHAEPPISSAFSFESLKPPLPAKYCHAFVSRQ